MSTKPPRRVVPKPGVIRTTGGRGRRGPLGVWLLANAARIQAAEAAFTLRWDDIGREAAAEGVEVRPGEPYGAKAVSNAWGELRRAGWVKPSGAQGQPAPRVQGAPAAPTQQVQGMVAASRGQAGTEGASGVEPPAPVPPSTATSPGSVEKSGEAAPKEPAFTARSLLPRRRFGDR